MRGVGPIGHYHSVAKIPRARTETPVYLRLELDVESRGHIRKAGLDSRRQWPALARWVELVAADGGRGSPWFAIDIHAARVGGIACATARGADAEVRRTGQLRFCGNIAYAEQRGRRDATIVKFICRALVIEDV